MGDMPSEETDRTAPAGKAKTAFLPRSLQAWAGLIFAVALWNIGSVHFMPFYTTPTSGGDSDNRGKRSNENHRMEGFVESSRVGIPRPANQSPNRSQQKPPPKTIQKHLTMQNNPPPMPRKESTQRTLALLYPPGLMGGYRNQVIRFIGLCLYAKQNNMTQLLEPSLLWSTQLHGIGTTVQWFPIPMDWLFDVDYWNEVAPAEELPRLVKNLPDSDCWKSGLFDTYNTSDWGPLERASFLESKSLVGATNETYRMITNDPTFKARRTDVLPAVSHCTQPFVYGGGKMGGRLWNDVMKWREKKMGTLPHHVDRAVLRALQPAPRWQQVAHSCLAETTTYVALHARIELEMFSHACGKTMERNLTNIFRQVQDLVEQREQQSVGGGPPHTISGLFVAVSRTGMAYSPEYNAGLREIADYNVQVFDHYVGHPDAKLGKHLNVFECGERLLSDYYRDNPQVPDHGSLLQAVVNFHLAVNAEIFVGVRGSSYSTDVWTTRYYLGKGKENYRYTQEGTVEKIENDGLPDPHVNCGTLNKETAPNASGGRMRMMNRR